RSRCQSGNAPGESRAFRNEAVAVRDEEPPAHLASRAERTLESCERRAGSGTQADQTEAGRAVIAVVAEASKKYRTAGRECAGRTSRQRVNRARAMPARRTSGGNRAPR